MKLLITIIICMGFSNCTKMSGTECDGNYYVPNCVGKNNGTFYLDTINNDWINSSFDSTMNFYNLVNGKTCSYYVNSYIKNLYKNETSLRKEKVKCGESTCYDYCYLEREELTYYPLANSPYRIIIYRGKNINYNSIDTSSLSKATDKFIVSFGLNYYQLNLNDYSNTLSQKFHSKLNLNNIIYDSIFEYNTSLPPNAIALQGFYYSKKSGIIGYYLTDKVELWVRN